MKCNNCGTLINKKDKFCNNCGNKIVHKIDNKYLFLIIFVFLFLIASPLQKLKEEMSFKNKINTAIKKVEEKYPYLKPTKEGVYINTNTSNDEWYAYVYGEEDKAFGAEVYYLNGKYTVNFSEEMYKYRQKLIGKMNELMPYNKNLNKYVSWLPIDFEYKTKSNSIWSGGEDVAYTVVNKNIDIEKQLDIDYKIFNYAYELSKEIGINLEGFWVGYYESDQNDFMIDNNNYLLKSLDRDLPPSTFEIYMFKDFDLCKETYCVSIDKNPKKVTKIGEYHFSFKEPYDGRYYTDLNSILWSKYNFSSKAHSYLD